ncbi:MAG: EAL domain-containing protein [Acidobacteriaceae bacterium]
MERRGTPGIRWAAILVTVLGAATAASALWQWSVQSKISTIQQLSALPDRSVVHLSGTVLAIDEAAGRIWIQDPTGAIPIDLQNDQVLGRSLLESIDPNPRRTDIHVGEALSIEAVKTGGVAAEVAPTPTPARKGGRVAESHGAVAVPKAVPPAPSAKKAGGHSQKPVPPPPVERGTPLAIVDAAPNVTLTVTKIVRNDARWIPVGLLAVFCVSWLILLQWRVRLQNAALRKGAETSHAIKLLSTSVQRLTREGTFDTEVPVQGDPEVAPLAIGVNAMLAELSQRDKAKRDADSRLQHWALIDDLTGLPNRRLLSDRLSQSLTKAQRDGTLLALLCVDLDGFKLVNDSLGHNNGDLLLAEVAQRLKTHFRQSDTVARTGGDEFALILDKIQNREDAQRAAEVLLELLKLPFEVGGQTIRTSASIGISIFPDGNERGQLMQQADCAMYAAKRNGRGRIVQFSDDLGSAARERLTLEGELQHAIAKGEISVLYQPEFDLKTNAIVRFEALARWTHPSLGKIVPMSFIPVAEENGLIIPLGAYMMERACTEAVAWQEIGSRPVQVAVNVSTVQFARDSFFEEVADVLHRTGLHPSLLQIELTESATVAGVERAAEMMKRLKRMGVSVAVDDFGTGYSCLSYLPKLSFDAVKLDRSFVHELITRRETRSFVKSILELAHNLHMTVIAEGIETREQLSLIRSLGTDEAQGFLLGRPSSEPRELLRQERSGELAHSETVRKMQEMPFVTRQF